MEIPYKEVYKNGLYSYIFVSGHHCYSESECRREFEILEKRKETIELAGEKEFLINFIQKLLYPFTILFHTRYSPELTESLNEYIETNWEYSFFSNDFTGTQVDKGFIRNSKGNSIAGRISFLHPFLYNITESSFGEFSSDISLYGINRIGKISDIVQKLNQEGKPDLTEILYEDEIFIHLSLAKEYGYFDSLLIKSKKDLPFYF